MQNFANPVFILIAGLSLSGLSACGLNSQVKVTTSSGVCSAGSIESSCAAQSSAVLSLTGRRPLAIKSGDTVTLTGTGFNKAMTATIGGIPVTFLDVTSATSALLVVPPGVATGMSDLKLALTAAEATASVAYMPSSEMQLFTGSVSEICAGVEFYDLNGDKQTGTKSCSGSSSTPECTANRVVGCVTTDTYQSADLTNLSAGNIKSGITIAGQLGDYPSVTYTLPGADATADLDSATFDAKVKSATAFEYWTSTGSYQTGAGDANISQANIKDTVSIFGTEGNLTAAVVPDPWNVRVGVTVNGVTGKLKVNCRNLVGSAFNYDGAISGIGQSAPVTPGTTIDIWDTVEDHNNNVSGLPPSIVTVWGSNTDCGGIDTPNLPNENNVWKDVTTTNGTTASTCAATSANCTMQDKITGLWWSKLQTAAAWNTAWSTCLTTLNGTPYGTNSVPGYNGQTGWRLPTQKELMDAYNHGIRSAASDNWITEDSMDDNYFWSGSSVSYTTYSAWNVNLARGHTNDTYKLNTKQVVCVR